MAVSGSPAVALKTARSDSTTGTALNAAVPDASCCSAVVVSGTDRSAPAANVASSASPAATVAGVTAVALVDSADSSAYAVARLVRGSGSARVSGSPLGSWTPPSSPTDVGRVDQVSPSTATASEGRTASTTGEVASGSSSRPEVNSDFCSSSVTKSVMLSDAHTVGGGLEEIVQPSASAVATAGPGREWTEVVTQVDRATGVVASKSLAASVIAENAPVEAMTGSTVVPVQPPTVAELSRLTMTMYATVPAASSTTATTAATSQPANPRWRVSSAWRPIPNLPALTCNSSSAELSEAAVEPCEPVCRRSWPTLSSRSIVRRSLVPMVPVRHRCPASEPVR